MSNRQKMQYEKTPLAAQTYQAAKDFGTKIQKNSLDYGEGDRVKHVKFGEGTVVRINDGGRDFEVTVEFDGAGRKKCLHPLQNYKKCKCFSVVIGQNKCYTMSKYS